MGTDTHPRERMIQSALILMGRQGVEGTSFSQVIDHSGAPRGSIYHHFPGGKEQLIAEAALDAIGGFWRAVLYDSDFAAGCPVVAAALEGDRAPAAHEAARNTFQR